MTNIITSVNAIIDGVIMGFAANAAKAALIVDYPFLGWPIINSFFNYFFDLGAQYFSNSVQQGADVSIIDTQTAAEKTAFAKAEAALRAVHANGDPHDILIATQNFKIAVAGLIHFDTVSLRKS